MARTSDGDERLTLSGHRAAASRTGTGYVRYEVGQGCYLTMFDDGAVRFVALPGDGRVIKPWRNNSSHPGGAVIDVKLDRE